MVGNGLGSALAGNRKGGSALCTTPRGVPNWLIVLLSWEPYKKNVFPIKASPGSKVDVNSSWENSYLLSHGHPFHFCLSVYNTTWNYQYTYVY